MSKVKSILYAFIKNGRIVLRKEEYLLKIVILDSLK
jgi:hypothetical protein